MKQYSKKLFSIAMLLSTAATAASVAPYLQFRSQGRNNARKVVGQTTFQTDLYDQEGWWGTFDATLEYDRSFRPQNITDALFGADALKLSTATTNNGSDNNNHGRSIVVSGSALDNRTVATDWMAENFLLPNNFRSVMTFSPLVQNVLVNFDWYMGLDKWLGGLYFRLYGPVVNNRTSLRFEETISSAGSNTDDDVNYPAGFFSENGVPVADLFSSAAEFFSGAANTNIEGITFNPLQYGKFQTTGHKSKTGFAELRGELGWNYHQEKYRVGFNIQAAAPTGTRPKAEFLLEPEIGNGKHWELGIGLKSLWTMWRSEDEEKHFDFVIEADITHLFKAKQTRTFDLLGKPNSRYMLAQRLDAIDGLPSLDEATDPSQVEFAQEYAPVANFSTRKVTSSFSVQGDVVAMFTYVVRGFSWDLGYNFWGLSTEKIKLSSTSTTTSSDISLPFPEDTWALKGDASIAGQTVTTNDTVYLAATESGATIHAGTNAGQTDPALNPGINSPIAAIADVVGGGTEAVESFTIAGPISTSSDPVFISAADLDLNGARMRGYSNKVFTHFGYTWTDRERWVPYVGLGVSAEFGSHSNNNGTNATTTSSINNNSSNSTSFGLSQWALWVKGGVSFH